jgi:hypothetical protein
VFQRAHNITLLLGRCPREQQMKHSWEPRERPSTVYGPAEWSLFCGRCGVEADEENEDEECEPGRYDSVVTTEEE